MMRKKGGILTNVDRGHEEAMMAVRVSKSSVKKALTDYGGNISAVALHFGKSRQTVYNWIERYGLRDMLADARDEVYDWAAYNVRAAVMKGDLDMSKFVLTHMPSSMPRWSSKTDFGGSVGLKLSADVMDLLAARGIEMSDVVAEFESLIRAEALSDAE